MTMLPVRKDEDVRNNTRIRRLLDQGDRFEIVPTGAELPEGYERTGTQYAPRRKAERIAPVHHTYEREGNVYRRVDSTKNPADLFEDDKSVVIYKKRD